MLERIKTEGFAHNAYLLSSGRRAVVIDPGRFCGPYSGLLEKNGLIVEAIFETHCNEDYVQGALELGGMTGAPVFHGPAATWNYGRELADGQGFRIGGLEITAMFTPGHTDDSVSYIVTDNKTGGARVMVFTGDTLFVNSVGRTDLNGPAEEPRMAEALYHSIFDRLLPLGDQVIICPAHSAGSVCGSHIADREESTLGLERMHNPALQVTSEAEFVKQRLADTTERPPYFDRVRAINLEGVSSGCPPLPPALAPRDFKAALDAGAVPVDTRHPAAFGGAHIKGAYSIWLEGLPEFAGWALAYGRPAALVLEDSTHVKEAAWALARLGFDNIVGYLKGGIETWYNAAMPVERLPVISVHELKAGLDQNEDIFVLDVRSREERQSGFIAGSRHIFVGYLERRLSEVPRDKQVAVLCSVGNRASLGASILVRAGYPRVSNVLGGMTAWNAARYPVVKEG
jgi:hydroxyacylglutathione hydrolase